MVVGLTHIDNISRQGSVMAEKAANLFVEDLKSNPTLAESVDFQEDNTMSNSTSLYTTTLSKFIYTKEYDKFQKYFDVIWNLTPADLGMPEGSGAYQIPKINGAKATKLAPGEKVEYVNKNKSHVTLETETYGIGTSISRRLLKRGAKGFVSKLMTTASNGVMRAVTTEIGNSMVEGADSNNNVGGGITIDAIADARYNVEDAVDANGIKFGFMPNYLVLTTLGKNVLTKSGDYKTIFGYGQMNVPGGELRTQYQVYDGMNIVVLELISVQKGGNDVHGMVVDSDHFLAFLKETEMEVFDGRIQGTAGDQEIIHAIDCGMVIMNSEAAAVITA